MTQISLVILLSLSIACGDDGNDEADAPDAAPGVCDTSTLTYESFGETFVATYCTGCHGTDVVNRQGAPAGVNFDSLAGIQAKATQIRARAGTGSSMPPAAASPKPTPTERGDLAEWIECGPN